MSVAISRARFSVPQAWKWLLTPTPATFFFALRTAIAACLALGIAFWMELDSPGWAANTVCAVAQLTRGESLSKARWRLAGTFLGATAAIFITACAPQYPWMFFLLIASWVGFCTTMATFETNFRAYAWVLGGYTCAIVAMDAAPNADQIFDFTVSRVTYIILGVLCEMSVAVVFSANLATKAKAQLQSGLLDILTQTSQMMSAVLGRDPDGGMQARKELASILALDSRIEFLELELGAYSHAGDHARAALNALSILVSRSFGMAVRLDMVDTEYRTFSEISAAIKEFLLSFPERLRADENFPDLLADLQHLRDVCRQYSLPPKTDAPIDETRQMNQRVLFISLGQLLGDLEQAILEFHASTHSLRGDQFKFYRARFRDWKLARQNGIRAALAILLACLFFECTAWNEGFKLISITGMCVGIFATKDAPILGSLNFFKGAFCAWIAAGFLALGLIPQVTIFEPLTIFFGGAIFLGALARGDQKLTLAAAAFILLLPLMLGLQNHHFMDEISFWNGDMAIVSAAFISMLVFRTIWPYDAQEECQRVRRDLLKELRGLANLNTHPTIQVWVSHSTERFTNLLNHAGQSDTPFIRMYLKGILSTLTLGLNILRLRSLLERDYLPPSARRPIILLLQYIYDINNSSQRAAKVASMAIERLREIDRSAISSVAHLEVTEALAYLIVMQHTLANEGGFLTATHLSPVAVQGA